jgi:hypothetical protein
MRIGRSRSLDCESAVSGFEGLASTKRVVGALVSPATCMGQQSRSAENLICRSNLTEGRNQKKNSNDFWSEWQDSNLRPLRPERSEHPLSY